MRRPATRANLVPSWRKQAFRSRPFVLEADRAKLREVRATARTYEQLLHDEDYAIEDGTHLQLGLLPVPFMGDLANADIFVALINPGYSICSDDFAETQPSFRNALLKNLRQDFSKTKYPLFALDPQFHWTSAGKWWHKLLGGIIKRFAECKCVTYVEASRQVASRLAALELVPYHSGNSRFIHGLSKQLYSSGLMKDYVRTKVIPRVEAGRALLLITSGKRIWGITDRLKDIVYPPKHVRRALFDPKRGAGRKILERLLLG